MPVMKFTDARFPDKDKATCVSRKIAVALAHWRPMSSQHETHHRAFRKSTPRASTLDVRVENALRLINVLISKSCSIGPFVKANSEPSEEAAPDFRKGVSCASAGSAVSCDELGLPKLANSGISSDDAPQKQNRKIKPENSGKQAKIAYR